MRHARQRQFRDFAADRQVDDDTLAAVAGCADQIAVFRIEEEVVDGLGDGDAAAARTGLSMTASASTMPFSWLCTKPS